MRMFIDKQQRDDFISFIKGMSMLCVWFGALFVTKYIKSHDLKEIVRGSLTVAPGAGLVIYNLMNLKSKTPELRKRTVHISVISILAYAVYCVWLIFGI